MFNSSKFKSIYHLLLILLLLRSFCRVSGFIVKVDVVKKKKVYYLNEEVPINFSKEIQNIHCIENTPIDFVSQDDIVVSKVQLKCRNDKEGSITLPKFLINSDEDIKSYKLQWNYGNDIIVKSDKFKVKKSVLSGMDPSIETEPSIVSSSSAEKDPNSNINDKDNIINSINSTNSTNSTSSATSDKEKENGNNNVPIENLNSLMTNHTATNATTTNDNNSNKKNNKNNNEFSVINKIMFAIIIFLIGGIMVISVSLIKTRSENKRRRMENKLLKNRRMENRRNQNNPDVTEIKFPPLKVNPLESQSFININNSSSYDIFDSSKYTTSIYVSSEESIIPVEKSNVTFPLENKKTDVNNFKSILSSPS
ncbi:hypothetical protein H8356DRAFT_1633691 [Neocallimastix lanati (nom. inval.)]|jgi:hypothetical protein|uniref:Mid2 domain-containing protein n=1 Tax=Neocallimastix californiae TaxID=1754190 RepID=A0A1Y2AFQ1_9FUNG|nr:hypothetical protein H8356DRAFT_1633691 [Neocallimastix sp. JGI-2020a]ORY21438.1 hypothetical protein LY90DRAFT_707458 [Neocallimastix californiae]|eukprot:ORY21438.1 hypothetical protein LY90DRAFT_707458 [Neocallimastix californiae]